MNPWEVNAIYLVPPAPGWTQEQQTRFNKAMHRAQRIRAWDRIAVCHPDWIQEDPGQFSGIAQEQFAYTCLDLNQNSLVRGTTKKDAWLLARHLAAAGCPYEVHWLDDNNVAVVVTGFWIL